MHIAIAFRDQDGAYIRTVGAMLASLLANTQGPFTLYALHDNTLTLANRTILSHMVERAGQRIVFCHIEPAHCLPGIDESSPILQPLTFATLYRLFLPHVVDVDRIIYLDTDIIVDTDVRALWEIPLGNAGRADPAPTPLLGAVPDPFLCGALLREPRTAREQWARDVARHSMRLGIPMSRYFNAGVLLLDLGAIRTQKLFDAALRLVLDTPQLVHPDQDALNKIFFDRTLVIPKKFNYLLHTDDVTGLTDGVWHYSGPHKPWKDATPKADRYAHFLARTPFNIV